MPPPTRGIVGTSRFAQRMKAQVMQAAKDPLRYLLPSLLPLAPRSQLPFLLPLLPTLLPLPPSPAAPALALAPAALADGTAARTAATAALAPGPVIAAIDSGAGFALLQLLALWLSLPLPTLHPVPGFASAAAANFHVVDA